MSDSGWSPKIIQRVVRIATTSTNVVVAQTDAGNAYIKMLGNPAGEHALARELVGTQLAELIGLRTLDYGVMSYDGTPEIVFHNQSRAKPGPAFVTRQEKLVTLDAGSWALDRMQNPEDVAKLVVFDTWTINADRYFPDETVRHPNRKNVVFSYQGKQATWLRAMDHTHGFTREPHLSAKIAGIDFWQDEKLYGLFPEFHRFIRPEYVACAVEALRTITRERIIQLVETIPPEWNVNRAAREALVSFLWFRLHYVADNVSGQIASAVAARKVS